MFGIELGFRLTRAFLCARQHSRTSSLSTLNIGSPPGYKIRRATSRSCAAAKLLPRDEGSHLQCICKVGHSP